MQVSIRKMAPEDMGQVISLLAKWNMAPVAVSAQNPHPERDSIDIANSFVAVCGDQIVGVCSYIVRSEAEAETASLAVDPEFLGAGVGYRLQKARLKEMKARGLKRVRTEADRPQTIRWYIDKFGYYVVGRARKRHAFSLAEVDHWTVLELDLERWDEAEKLIVNAALTGVVPTREQNPALPITPRQIARDAVRVHRLGASMVHIHARDRHGRPTSGKAVYREIIGRIRERCPDLIIVASTSGRRTRSLAERMEVLELDGAERPEMASLTLGSLNFPAEESVSSPETIASLLAAMRERGILPELEIFGLGMANYAKSLMRRGLLGGPLYANIILGSLGTTAASPRHLVGIVDELPEGTLWAATGVGRYAFQVQSLAMAMGGGVRVGLEDSLYMDRDKEELATNERLVARLVRLAEALGRRIARPREVRRLLGL